MDIVRKKMSYKCFGTEASKVFNSEFYSNASFICNYLLAKGIKITAEYLPGALTKKANFQSRVLRDLTK